MRGDVRGVEKEVEKEVENKVEKEVCNGQLLTVSVHSSDACTITRWKWSVGK